MLRCRAHTAVKSDEDDEQGNHVLNYSDMSQGIMGTVTAGQAVQEYSSGAGDDLQHRGLMMVG